MNCQRFSTGFRGSRWQRQDGDVGGQIKLSQLLQGLVRPLELLGVSMALVLDQRELAQAHRWKAMLASGTVTLVEALAAHVRQRHRHVERTLALAFLSPEITRSILRGEQPVGLRLAHLLDAKIPPAWTEQRALIARLPPVCKRIRPQNRIC